MPVGDGRSAVARCSADQRAPLPARRTFLAGGRISPVMAVRQAKFFVGGGLFLAALAGLLITGFEEGKAYYQTVGELQAMGPRAEGRRVRVAGDVVPGTIASEGEGRVRFQIEHEGATPRGALHRPGAASGHPGGPGAGRRGRTPPRGRLLRGEPRAGEVRLQVRRRLRRNEDRTPLPPLPRDGRQPTARKPSSPWTKSRGVRPAIHPG